MKVAMLGNTDLCIYNYRFELINRLIAEGHQVVVITPDGKSVQKMIDAGCEHIAIEIDRHGTNPIKDFSLIKTYKRILKEINPDVVLSYTIKPNIYGALACKKLKIPCIVNVTGLGTAVEKKGLMQVLTVFLYKFALNKVQTIFFQNDENMKFFSDRNIYNEKHKLIPGSGVNLKRFTACEYPQSDIVHFSFISRIMKEKGIEEYLEAANFIKAKYPNTSFNVYGFCEKEYTGKLHEYNDKGVVTYHGMIDDVSKVLKDTSCTIMPTYYPEGLCNVLLESCATARPIITTNRSGCREVVDDGINGFIVEEKSTSDLISKIEMFLNMPYEKKKELGLAGRRKVEKQFDREIIIEAYLRELQTIKL